MKKINQVEQTVPQIGTSSTVYYKNKEINTFIYGVNERMQEIEIRKSVGEKARQIEIQFLLEAALFSTSGAIIGILLSFFIQTLLAFIMKWNFYFPYGIMIISFFISISIGLIFGYFPAKKAASISPAERLRQ